MSHLHAQEGERSSLVATAAGKCHDTYDPSVIFRFQPRMTNSLKNPSLYTFQLIVETAHTTTHTLSPLPHETRQYTKIPEAKIALGGRRKIERTASKLNSKHLSAHLQFHKPRAGDRLRQLSSSIHQSSLQRNVIDAQNDVSDSHARTLRRARCVFDRPV